jgi:hypothetical protein
VRFIECNLICISVGADIFACQIMLLESVISTQRCLQHFFYTNGLCVFQSQLLACHLTPCNQRHVTLCTQLISSAKTTLIALFFCKRLWPRAKNGAPKLIRKAEPVVEGDDRLQILVSQPSRPMTIHCAALSAFTCAFVTLLQCYDEDNGSDDFIGSVTVHLNQVFAQGGFHLHGSCSLVYSTYAPFQASETSIFLSSPNPPSHQAKSG